MRMKPLPMATVATQTDSCSEDGSYWDLLSLTSLLTDDNDDVSSVVNSSGDEATENNTAVSSQTDLGAYSDSCSSWRLSCAGLSDDDGYDVIIDDSDDSSDVFDDSFVRREARRRVEQAEMSSFRRAQSKTTSLKLAPIFEFLTSRDAPVVHPVTEATSSDRPVNVQTTDPCNHCKQNRQSTPPTGQQMRSVPRMGTRMGPRLQRPVTATTSSTCTCGRRDIVRDSSQVQRRGGHAYVGTTSLSDSEKSSVTLTEVQYRRAWSSDGDAPAAAVDTSSSSDANSASELSPTFPAAGSRDAGQRAVDTTPADPGQSGSKLTGSSAAARRQAYEQFADVMYTNRANLQHTIAVQQRLFQQQLLHPDFHGYINAALGQRPVSPRKGSGNSGERGEKSSDQLEWVVRRRADGTRYITRRPVISRHRSRRHNDVISGSSKQLTSSSAERKNSTGKLQSGRSDQSKRKEVKDACLGSATERTRTSNADQPGKSTTAFHNAPVTSLQQAHQHPILAVITM